MVSDGSDPKTRQAVERFNDPRIKYYEIAHSGKPAVPRNFGIRKAEGEYIAFCDDDDIWMPEKLKFQIDKICQDNELGLVYTKCLLEEDDKVVVVPRNGKEGFIFKELFLSPNFIANSTVLIKKEVINTVGMFDEDIRLKAAEDFDLWLRIAMRYKIGFIDRPLVIHREISDSLTKGTLVKLKIQPLVHWQFYRKKYVRFGLFIKKLLLIFYRSILIIIHYDRILHLSKRGDRK